MPLNERATREQLIDKALEAAGWKPVVNFREGEKYQRGAVREYPTANGPVDYALCDNGALIALVEAKRSGVGPQNVLQQAQRYARGLNDSPFNFNGYHVPFIYSTNGTKFFFQDLREHNSYSREVAAFHTPAALREMLTRDTSSAAHWLRETPNDIARLRPYQRDAIQDVEQAILAGKRKMLVAMATGTGKTFTTISLIYRLMKSGFAKRVLFLVDRRALAAQAVTEMNKFDAEPGLKFSQTYEVYSQQFRREDLGDEPFDPKVLPTEYLTNPQPQHTFVYVCTIQRMRINLFGKPSQTSEVSETSEVWDDESDAGKLDIPIHAFDLIIADECHRGYTSSEESKWREVLDHFDGIRIGLTATPAAHTTTYFKEIVYRYEYERAVREGYLVDYDPVRIQSRIKQEGVFLKPGEEVGLKDRATGQLKFDLLEDERELPASTNEQDWTAPDTNRQIVKAFADYARKQAQELGHFPKTLFFAYNDLPHTSHADQLVELLREEFGQGDAFVQKITGSPSVDRPLQRIREFRNRPETGIAVTVDLLSTGVDIPALENIVLMRPIKSRILFEQILGRGTRKCDAINKTHFTVFDAAGVLEYFQSASAFTSDPPSKPTRQNKEIIEDIYNNRDRAYNTRVLVRRLQRMAKNISGQGRGMFQQFTGTEDISGWARDLPSALENNWGYIIGTLRNPAFQDFLDKYPRARDPFIVAESAIDEVKSESGFKTADGRMLKPKDYIAEFEKFVRENPEHIEAIRILLERPADWSTDALRELRDKLATRPEQFTEARLRVAYQHALADIISIVHHAARREPLLTAEERVNQAMKNVRAKNQFTPQQEKWLELIHQHLISNLSIGQDDFNLVVIQNAGGTWARVNRDFGGKLPDVIRQINEAVAAV